jgi:F-type H+-transporting ATPase subunit b
MGKWLITPDPGLIIWTVVTFLALLFILKRFAWKPILGIIEGREKAIREALEESKRAREAADEALAKNRELLAQARGEAARIVSEGQKEAERLRAELIEKAKSDAASVLEQGRRQIEFETRQAVSELKATVADLALDAAGKLIRTSLDDAQHRRLVEEYLQDLPAQKGDGSPAA